MSDRAQRVDARRNYERLLGVAATVVAEDGTDASLRDIARRAGVGLGTLYRHFPTRDALLEALVRQRFDRLAATAETLHDADPPGEALRRWLGEFTVDAAAYRGLPASIMATLDDEDSPLHASCAAMRQATTRLLVRAQRAGEIRSDVEGMDLFVLVNALSWAADLSPSIAARREMLFAVVMDGLSC